MVISASLAIAIEFVSVLRTTYLVFFIENTLNNTLYFEKKEKKVKEKLVF